MSYIIEKYTMLKTKKQYKGNIKLKQSEFAIVCHCSNSKHLPLYYIQDGIIGDKIGDNIKYIDPLCPEDNWDNITNNSLMYIWGIFCPIYTSHYDAKIITKILENSLEKLKLNGRVLFPVLDEYKNNEYFTINSFNGFTFSKLHINQLSFIIDKKIPKYTEYYVFTKIKTKKLPKDCLDGKVRNPVTGRCILVKNAKVKNKSNVKKLPKDCLDGRVRNPATGRCILVKNAKANK